MTQVPVDVTGDTARFYRVVILEDYDEDWLP